MKIIALFLLCLVTACAQDVTASLAPTQTSSETALPANYAYPNTAVGGTNGVTVRLRDTTTVPVEIIGVIIGTSAGSLTASSQFTVTGQVVDKVLAANTANSFEDVTVSFSPSATGSQAGYLEVVYLKQQNGCSFTSQGTPCTASTSVLSALSGVATSPALTLTYTAAGTTVTPQANSATPINFGNVSTSASAALTFTLQNNSASAAAVPAIALQTAVFGSSGFVLDTSHVPSSIAPGSAATFIVTFAPGQTGLTTATLTVGSASYSLTGTGIVVATIDALQISYYDSTGVRTSPQAATPISFDQLTAGAASTSVLTFTVTNPSTSFSGISVASVVVTGSGFSLTNAPSMPATLAPGASLTFKLVFSGNSVGTFTGTLSIATRQFALTGRVINSPLPDATFVFDQQPTASQMQPHLTIQLASASSIAAIGQLAMSFQPSVANITDDPAVQFTATGGRALQVSVASGDTTASYSGQSAIGFQTGTTAGTLTFTLTFPNKAAVTQSFSINPVLPGLSSITAVRQDPYLIVTVTGFDNSYSVNSMAFTFADASGAQVNATPMTVDVSSAFHNYFFGTSNTAGGAFVVQAKFPVTGDVTQIGSIQVGIRNSSGTSTTSKAFQ